MLDSLSKTMSRSGIMATFTRSEKPPSSVASSKQPSVASSSTTKLKAESKLSGISSNISSAPSSANSTVKPKKAESMTVSSSSTLSRGSLGLQPKTFSAQVVFLDDTTHLFDLDKRAKGQAFLDMVFNHLDLQEREYFGLMFCESGGALPTGHSPDVTRWLDPHKMVRKQISGAKKHGQGVKFYFRVKFYVTDPSRLYDEHTRYHMYLQVRHDLSEGRLSAPASTLCLLISFAVQSTLGDYENDARTGTYLAPFWDLRKQCLNAVNGSNHIVTAGAGEFTTTASLTIEEFDRRIIELHKLHRGQSPADAEMNFLEHAKRLEMYGISLHDGKDSQGRDIQLGVTCIGLVVFQNSLKINTFSWSKIVKISFKRKQFFIQLRKELTENYDTMLGFNLATYRSCKNLWKSAVEHHSFFRLHTPKMPHRRFLLNLGSKFRYSGRTEFQTSHLDKTSSSQDKSFSRTPSKSFLRKTLPLNLEQPSKSRVPRLASPETSSIGSSVHSNGALKLPKPSAPPVRQDQVSNSSGSSLAHRAIESFNNKVQSLSTKLPKKAWQEVTSDDEGGFLDQSRKISSLGRLSKTSSTITTSTSKHPFTQNSIPSIRLAYADDSTSERGSQVDSASSNGGVTRSAHSVRSTPAGPNGETVPDSGSQTEDGLIIIHIIPDDQGRFGFNVKGGADQKMPIIVSRVGPNTPADKCYPRLNEGDQIVFINSRDVSQHTHDQVVNFIRASSEPHSGQLTLAVRQNVYMGEEVEEPEFQYVPETPHVSPLVPGTQALAQSMMLLEESLESNAIVGQFEQLYRRNTSLTMNECNKPDNMGKNRYRDILPYDATRVVLRETNDDGDYINANHVVMTIPGSGIVNRYIATQGPLNNTCGDFWAMTWETQSNLIIMLTTLVERGRPKCYKYWPEVGETMEYNSISVKSIKEDIHESFAFRDFILTHAETQEERHVTQMAYLSWPDHGTPDSSDEFVDFVETVRKHRLGSLNATIVHCSAGIGRTGVLILMETSLYLIEANQPVYPLDLTRTMRDQRASMIQTPSQYKFVCQAILKVYKEGKVKPLPEFRMMSSVVIPAPMAAAPVVPVTIVATS